MREFQTRVIQCLPLDESGRFCGLRKFRVLFPPKSNLFFSLFFPLPTLRIRGCRTLQSEEFDICGKWNAKRSHIEMYLDLELERPGLRRSLRISGLEGARGCGYGTLQGEKHQAIFNDEVSEKTLKSQQIYIVHQTCNMTGRL
ncbi:hypothetical protein TNCV_4164561 [Trichonephila clavipes]|nr:hypothetical protein TNCV_4164561 [Trichonephila clavipes]